VDEFFKTIRKINEEGTTILLIEQNARKALSIATHGYVLQKGEIVVQGSKGKLYENDMASYFKLVLPHGQHSKLKRGGPSAPIQEEILLRCQRCIFFPLLGQAFEIPRLFLLRNH
jgi:ABC-type multidrug transport system ATPase subunit